MIDVDRAGGVQEGTRGIRRPNVGGSAMDTSAMAGLSDETRTVLEQAMKALTYGDQSRAVGNGTHLSPSPPPQPRDEWSPEGLQHRFADTAASPERRAAEMLLTQPRKNSGGYWPGAEPRTSSVPHPPAPCAALPALSSDAFCPFVLVGCADRGVGGPAEVEVPGIAWARAPPNSSRFYVLGSRVWGSALGAEGRGLRA